MAKPPSQRQLRVGELVRHALSDVLARETLDEPALTRAPVTITEVRMSPDLKIATAYVTQSGTGQSGTGPGSDAGEVVKALARKAKFLRGRAAAHLNQMKYMPTFRFREDESFDNFARIDALLNSPAVRRDLEAGDGTDEERERD